MFDAICLDCGAAFRTDDPRADQCPRCARREAAMYRNDPSPYAEAPLRLYARRSMQERLSVSGEVDE